MNAVVNEKLNLIINNLQDSNYVTFDTDLKYLSETIQFVKSQKENVLQLETVERILNFKLLDDSIEGIRLHRGLLLVIRNMTMYLDQNWINLVILSFCNVQVNSEWESKVCQTYWEILANFNRLEDGKELILRINHLFKEKQISVIPVIHFLFRQFSTLDPEITNENLLQVLRLNDNHILETVHKIYTTIDFDNLNHDFKLFIHLLYDIITHESFGNWILNTDAITSSKWSELTSVILETKDNWNNYELIALISWNMEIFSKYSSLLIEINNVEIENILVPTLHSLGELSKFNIMKQYLKEDTNLQNEFLSQLIQVLRFIHENVKPSTIKDKVTEVKYPSAKLNIILILSYLSHEDFQVQETVRELGGLNLVLSNCTIDNNNPYIKEHSILCIKYLLEKNVKNQQFVGELEAKKVIDDEVLDDIGYQMEIVDGKVGMKKK